MTFNAFTESQAEILKQLASASPTRWEYQVKEWLSICDSIRGIQEVEAYLAEKHAFLMRAQIDLPPRHVLSQYVNLADGSLMYVRCLDEATEEAQEMIKADPNRCSGLLSNGVLKLGPFRIEGVLGDPVQWVTSAFINVELLLKRLEGLNELCKSERTAIEKSKDRFVLDPPSQVSNPIIKALMPIALEHFDGMTAQGIYDALKSGFGVMRVRYHEIQQISAVIQAIVAAFDFKPSDLAGITVITSLGRSLSWTYKSGKPRFADNWYRYVENNPSDEKGFSRVHEKVKSSLKSANSQNLQYSIKRVT